MIKTSHIALALGLGFFLRATVAHADLVSPAGEGASACRNKKAGDECENDVIVGMELKHEIGKCVEADLKNAHLKYSAHLRCFSAHVPRPPPSAAAPSASAITTASANPPETPPASPLSPVSPAAPIDSAKTPPEPLKSGGCSIAFEPEKGIALGFVALGLGILLRKRRAIR